MGPQQHASARKQLSEDRRGNTGALRDTRSPPFPASTGRTRRMTPASRFRSQVASRNSEHPAAEGGQPFPVLVPQVDADGNERDGVRLPEITVPLATYTGWNLRDPSVGAPDQRVAFEGPICRFPRPLQNARRPATRASPLRNGTQSRRLHGALQECGRRSGEATLDLAGRSLGLDSSRRTGVGMKPRSERSLRSGEGSYQ